MKYDKLDQKMLEMKDEIFAAVKENVAIESVKGEPEENAPFGAGPKAALDNVLELGARLGFKTVNLDNKVGWIEYGDGDEMAAVLGHVDIVPLGEGWNYDPLGCEIHDGKMYGRGVLDDKGPIIGAIYGLKAIRDLGLSIDRRIRIMVGTDEENGSACVKHYVNSGEEMPAIGFTPDAEFPVIFFEKGAVSGRIVKKLDEKPEVKVLSITGGTAANVVMPVCTMVVEGDFAFAESDGIKVTKEGGNTIIVSKGTSAHGSTPELGVNAGIQLFTALREQKVKLGGDLQKVVDFIMDKIGTDTEGEGLGIRYTDEETGTTSLCIGVIHCTEDECSFTIDYRYPNHTDSGEALARFENEARGYGLKPELRQSANPLYVSKESELVRKLVSVYREKTGDMTEPLAIGGGTYAKAFQNMVAFGPVFPGEPDVIHQPNECAEVDKLMQAFQIIAAAMYEIACK